jgi:hypothetical protein
MVKKYCIQLFVKYFRAWSLTGRLVSRSTLLRLPQLMKNALLKFLTVSMACLVLLSSTGFGLVEHDCLMRGKSMQLHAAQAPKGCQSCVKKGDVHLSSADQTVVKKADCCKDEQKYEKLDIVSSLSQLIAKVLKTAAEAALLAVKTVLFSVVQWLLPDPAGASVVHSFSSLFHGRSMLSFVQSFLI